MLDNENKKISYRSFCCNAQVILGFRGEMIKFCYRCKKCGQKCEVY